MTETVEQVDLGHTGLQVSRLCFGTGTNGWNHRSDQGDLGLERLPFLLRWAHERGVTFWDTADQYGTHPHVVTALREVERESVTITTKTTSHPAAQVRKDLERFFTELRTDYLDIVLLHGLTEASWTTRMQGAMEVLSEYKSRGRIRAVGISSHGLGALQTAAGSPWVDVVLARINHAGHNMDASPDKVIPVLDQIAAAGKGIYGMKVAMRGPGDPARAVSFVRAIPAVHAMVIGMMNEEEIQENIRLVKGPAPAC